MTAGAAGICARLQNLPGLFVLSACMACRGSWPDTIFANQQALYSHANSRDVRVRHHDGRILRGVVASKCAWQMVPHKLVCWDGCSRLGLGGYT
jgi:hypothetical protein